MADTKPLVETLSRRTHARNDSRGGRGSKGKEIKTNCSKDLGEDKFRERDNGEALDLPSTARD